jgi:hypothetical protein
VSSGSDSLGRFTWMKLRGSNWWNSSVSFLYGTMKTICESGHAWAIAQ